MARSKVFFAGGTKGPNAPTIAALYVQTGGCYYGLPDVEPWDEQLDARLYDGPHYDEGYEAGSCVTKPNRSEKSYADLLVQRARARIVANGRGAHWVA